jgi:hypothetical protein
MNTADQAVARVRDVLYENDEDLYVYQPPGEDHFIGEAVVIGAAGVFLGAFFKGIQASAEKRMEAWGESVGTWVFDRIQALFRRGNGEASTREAKQIAAEARRAVASSAGALTPDQLAQVEARLRTALAEQGIPDYRAADIARAVAAEGSAVLQTT